MSQPKPLDRPVFYLHATGRGPARPDEIDALRDLGCDICSRLGAPGTIRTEHGYDAPLRLLRELADRFPGRPVGFIRAGLAPGPEQLDVLERILQGAEEPTAVTLLSNACTGLNPYAGLKKPVGGPDWEPGEAVALLAPGHLHRLEHWADHFTLLSPSAVAKMAEFESADTPMQVLSAVGGRLVVPDHLFLHDPGRDVFEPRTLHPWESLYPPPFGDLSARLQHWLDAGIRELPIATAAIETATLHITHNWGGGIAHWIETFIDSDRRHVHFQLRAEGPQSDYGCGQRLSLYAANELRCAVASWWLQPPIRSVEDHDAGYREILEGVCRRYRIGRLIVSSLIGHSLDVLRTGLPTIQVLHDHFPLWPLLSVHPGPFLRERRPVDLAAALAAHAGDLEFTDKDAAGWNSIREAYLRALADNRVRVVAPGRSVLEMQNRLEPAFETQRTRVIPHGSAIADARRTVAPRPRTDGRLRMVVLGRIQAGKGRKLLLEAIGRLAEQAQVYLLGSGKSGEAFFGVRGVDVVTEYRREELAELLESIGPDFAALLSIVPETFSYTLSELQALGIPVVATRVGSFPERIVHGETGWLIEADPDALVERVAALRRSPAELDRVRAALRNIAAPGADAMLAAYDDFCPPSTDAPTFVPTEPGMDQGQFAASAYQLALSEQSLRSRTEQISDLQDELESRTEWALDVQRQLEHEHGIRTEFEHKFAATSAALAELNQRHLQAVARYEARYRQAVATYEARYRELAEQHDQVLGSTSWKITRPLRFARRVAQNLVVARAWNPLRWPRLLGNLFRNLSTRGLRGALQGLQYGSDSVTRDHAAPQPAPEHPPEQPTAAGADPAPAPQAPESLPLHDRPDASIVIPVYNKWRFTAACLRSLADTGGRRSFEVIVVDDGSTDESESELRRIDGLRYVRNERNLGFVGSCNRGAALARGDYLVMLNNDTEVTDGWLDALIDTLENEPEAGLVGARLVYPSGRLQEAGGIIFSDGSGWNYGREDDPGKPSYNYLREVDYCSGACIAMRTRLFRDLGGFDERYAPAYYEDTDFAFRVRRNGLKVLVQPAATVIHHEGATSGTDLSSGVKQYQRINQRTFVERWRGELESQPEDVADKSDHVALRAASQHRVKGRLLFLGAAAGQGRAENELLTGLLRCGRALGYGVTLIVQNSDFGEEYARSLRMAGVEVIDGPWLDSLDDLLGQYGSAYGHVFVSRGQGEGGALGLVRRHCGDARVVFSAEKLYTDDCRRLADLLHGRA